MRNAKRGTVRDKMEAAKAGASEGEARVINAVADMLEKTKPEVAAHYFGEREHAALMAALTWLDGDGPLIDADACAAAIEQGVARCELARRVAGSGATEVPWDVGRLPSARDVGAQVRRQEAEFPTWAGVPRLKHVYGSAIQGFYVERMGGSSPVASPAGQAYASAAIYLPQAHPIVFSTAQIRALPALPWRELVEFAAHYRPPFPAVWLDFGGAEVATQQIRTRMNGEETKTPLTVIGALVLDLTKNEAARAMNENGQEMTLAVLPFVDHTDGRDGPHYSNYESQVMAFMTGSDPVPATEAVVKIGGADTRIMGLAAADGAIDVGAPVEAPTELPGYVHVLTPADYMKANAVSEFGHLPRENLDRVLFALGTAGLRTVLNALYFLDSRNVELCEAPLHRRDIKRAVKRGWGIASSTRVSRTIRRASRAAEGEGSSRYQGYQGEVAAHFKHVARGPHVRCKECKGTGKLESWEAPGVGVVPGPGVYRPTDSNHGVDAELTLTPCHVCAGSGVDGEVMKPCTRRDDAGNLTCPHGCRREWVPEHVRGDPDGPLVMRTRKVG